MLRHCEKLHSQQLVHNLSTIYQACPKSQIGLEALLWLASLPTFTKE